MTSFDKVSQQTSIIYEKIINNITETWLFYEIIRSISCRMDLTKIGGPLLVDYLNKEEKFQLIDSCNNKRLTIREFTKCYTEKSISSFDNKLSPNMDLLANLSPFWSNLAIFDNNRREEKKMEFIMINHFDKVDQTKTKENENDNNE